MEHRDVTVRLPGKAVRAFGRERRWTVTIAGTATGEGPSLTTATANAAFAAADLLRHAHDDPAFAVDDDGALIVAIPDGSGCAVYRVKDGRACCFMFGSKPPAETLHGVPHYTMIPR